MATLSSLQDELKRLWTLERYNEEFRRSEVPHRDFEHALIHVFKAAGKLAVIVEEADHTSFRELVLDARARRLKDPVQEVRKHLADLVICTLRMANTCPEGVIDVERAVLDRIEEKMGARPEGRK